MAGGIAERVTLGIQSTVEENGCSIWDVEYVKEGSRNILRITIDSENGVDIDTCEKVSRAIDPVLDELDPIQDPYYLEVSSPGLERDIRTEEHYLYAVGQKVDIKLFTAVDGVKALTGVLEKFDREGASVTVDGKELPLKKISKCNIHFDFDD